MFRILLEDEKSEARIGELRTSHGAIRTPAFLPVATKGTVKMLTSDEIENTGTQALIVNSFHLFLRGREAVQAAGGLHEFMSWKRPIFTDSGGFQIIRKGFKFDVTEEGFLLKSPVDGKMVKLTPAISMSLQEELDSDVAFALDDCPPYPSSTDRVRESVERTARWAKACKESHEKKNQLLFGIVQGGNNQDLRKRSARELVALDFDGYGIGGLSIGEPAGIMLETTRKTISFLPREKPRHLLGLGSPIDIVRAVERGVDVFDSAFPTRNGRHGTFYTMDGTFDIKKRAFAELSGPLDEGCRCYTCQHYLADYIHHMFRERELLSMRLLSIHNLFFAQELIKQTHQAIKEGAFQELEKNLLSASE